VINAFGSGNRKGSQGCLFSLLLIKDDFKRASLHLILCLERLA
jgi:hypothetical protein